MKRISYIIFVMVLFAVGSCSEDRLEKNMLFQKSLESFYGTPTEIDEAMNGIYNALYVGGALSNEHIASSLMSDCMLGGGGPDDKVAKDVDNFIDPSDNTYAELWKETYNGVYRCNGVIEAIGEKDFRQYFKTDEELNNFKNQALGEAYFMRGFFMFRAAKFFGGMPLIYTTDADRLTPRATFKETFEHIVSDFKIAAETMPNVNAMDIPIEEYGHANRWVAQAYLAKAFLFATGYLTNIEKQATSSITLLDGTTLDNTAVATVLKDCIDNSGYELTPDFRNLWPYSYVNTSASLSDENYDPASPVLPWADTEGLAWVGQDGPKSTIGTGNKEVMFALRYSFADWQFDKQNSYTNMAALFFGVRGQSLVPFGQGWGWGTIHKKLDSDWKDRETSEGKEDVRRKGSILYVGDAENGTGSYKPAQGDQETGMFNKKYSSLQHNGSNGIDGMFKYIYGVTAPDYQLWHAQDFYYMRFADVLLMHSELTETNDGLNAVRARAGLDPIAYSLQALKDERKFEFAFEGIRWFDIVRWGDVENPANNYFDNEIDVTMASGSTSTYSVNYRKETKGLVSIPEREINLLGGVYEQNPGW